MPTTYERTMSQFAHKFQLGKALGRCWCGKVIKGFRDDRSRDRYDWTGQCQECQDKEVCHERT